MHTSNPLMAVTVKASEVQAAIQRAEERDTDWQAMHCEVAMIPTVARRWAEGNERFAGLRVERHDGIAHKGVGFVRERNLERCDASAWMEVCGYTLIFNDWSRWNFPRETHYSHSASSTYDGIRRETVASILEMLINAYSALTNGDRRALSNARLQLWLLWKVEFEDDLYGNDIDRAAD